MLKTESPSLDHTRLDEYSVGDLVNAFADDQLVAVNAVRAAGEQIAAAVSAAVPRLERGGRLIYVGAGTSGRLGLLDSVELYPTFSWPQERASALLAGGQEAVYQAVEGAEDRTEQGCGRFERDRPGAERRGHRARGRRHHALHAGCHARCARSRYAHDRHRQQS